MGRAFPQFTRREQFAICVRDFHRTAPYGHASLRYAYVVRGRPRRSDRQFGALRRSLTLTRATLCASRRARAVALLGFANAVI
jgi:hypothetical protein